jgi:hypothetical protein
LAYPFAKFKKSTAREIADGMIVRRLVGYGRFEGVLAGESLAGCMRRHACTATCSNLRSNLKRSDEKAHG